jgi:hypothetical protein
MSRGKSNGAHARAAANRLDDEPGLNFLEEEFEADTEVDAALIRKRRQLHRGDIGDCQPSPLPSDCRSRPWLYLISGLGQTPARPPQHKT